MKQKILVHLCCAICGVALIEKLKEKFEPTIFFYNPNIYPVEEYNKRKESVIELAKIYGVDFVEGEYDAENWTEKVKGKEQEPERGGRCYDCFEMRLEKSAEFAKENSFEIFTTSLFISPFKDEKVVNEVAKKVAEKNDVKFLSMEEIIENKLENWKKTRELSKKYNFYSQKYCGCIFSIN
jgi:hypothetical protein